MKIINAFFKDSLGSIKISSHQDENKNTTNLNLKKTIRNFIKSLSLIAIISFSPNIYAQKNTNSIDKSHQTEQIVKKEEQSKSFISMMKKFPLKEVVADGKNNLNSFFKEEDKKNHEMYDKSKEATKEFFKSEPKKKKM